MPTAVVLAAAAAMLAAAVWAVLSPPQFAARMDVARLALAKATLLYGDGHFVNLQPETPARLASPGGDIVRLLSCNEAREPPVMAVDNAALAARGAGFFVPLDIGAHLERWGVARLQIARTPTRHDSGRGLNDRSATLWSSWSVARPQHSAPYSGDSGDGTHLQEIGNRLRSFDTAFVKTGADGPGASWIDIHRAPEQAVQAHRDVWREAVR